MHFAKGKLSILTLFLLFGASILAAALLEYVCVFGHIFYFPDEVLSDFNSIYPIIRSLISFKRVAICFLLFSVFFIAIKLKGKTIGDFIYKYRYIFAFAFLAFCVVLNLSGSSIGCWERILNQTDGNGGVIFGISRSVRSDEWAANTPMAFSQQYNNFPYFNNIVRGDNTDMFIVYGQPVWSILEIFRPFHWGYLLLGVDRGLSFFWCARLVALFMVSFEFSMNFFKKSRAFSVMFAFLIAFAPVVQWWFAINGLVEMLIFGMLAVICIKLYMTTESYLKRSIFAFITLICAGGYILTFYPAWQVPLFYVFFALAVSVIISNRKGFKFRKKDALIVSLFVVALIAGMGAVFLTSADTINAVLNTSYPGKRIGTGGELGDRLLFSYVMSPFFPIQDTNLPGDASTCENAFFFSFFPLGIIISVYAMIRKKKPDAMLISLLIAELFIGSYCVFGWSGFLAKITAMSYTTGPRALVALTFIDVLLLFKSVSLKKYRMHTAIAVVLAILFTALAFYFSNAEYSKYMEDTCFATIILIALPIVSFLILKSDNNIMRIIASVVVSALFAFSGLLVNPIRIGNDVIYKNEVTQSISDVVKNGNPDGKWIVDSNSYPMTNLPIMVGAPTINSTNVYPNIKRWEKFDPNGENKEIYNRYAHIRATVNEDPSEETSFKLENPDMFALNLNVNDLKKLDVSYILSPRELETLSNDSVSISKIKDTGNGLKIFDVTYK